MDKFSKFVIAVLVGFVLGMCIVNIANATQPPGFGSVQDNNNGTEGQVLINSGTDHGNSDVGAWTDADFLKGEDGIDGVNGVNGNKGKDFDARTVNNINQRLNELEQPKYYFVPQVRIYDSKKIEIKPYAKFNVQDNMNFSEAGIKVTFKIGKSYEEKLIEELKEQLGK